MPHCRDDNAAFILKIRGMLLFLHCSSMDIRFFSFVLLNYTN